MTQTKVRSTAEIVAELAPAYKEWKGGEKDKNKLKDEFFEAITDELAAGELSEKVIAVPEAQTAEEGERWVVRHDPFWEVTDCRENPDGEGYEYIIRERPEYKSFYIDHDGYTYGRQVAQGPTLLDDEALKDEDPELWFEVTEFPNEDFILDLVYETGMDPERVEDFISLVAERHGLTRQLKSLGDLDPDVLVRIKPYTYDGKPVVKLPAPKKVKE